MLQPTASTGVDSLKKTLSRYLSDRIESTVNIELPTRTEVVALECAAPAPQRCFRCIPVAGGAS